MVNSLGLQCYRIAITQFSKPTNGQAVCGLKRKLGLHDGAVVVEKMEKVEFHKEIITVANIRDYKNLIDSIRYICDFNGFDKNFEYDEDIKILLCLKMGK